MRLHEQRQVDRPQKEVFDYTADFSNIADWDPGVAASRRLGTGPLGVGTRFELEVEFGPSTIPMVYEITAFEPHRRVVLTGRGKTLEAVDEITFQAVGEDTIIDYTADLRFLNWVRFAIPFVSPLLRRVGERAVDGLVSALSR
jgi:carbon monoxide dehydrogenase subunit G